MTNFSDFAFTLHIKLEGLTPLYPLIYYIQVTNQPAASIYHPAKYVQVLTKGNGVKKLSGEIENKTIYLISGPCGVGKSTVSEILTRMVTPGVLIEGDYIMSMFGEGSEPPWGARLQLTWKNILALTRNFIQHDFNVVIDFVVEDELEWFCSQISDLDVRIKFVVLIATRETLTARLVKRGETDLIDRSLFLLDQMEASATHRKFMYDTSATPPAEIAAGILDNSRFYIGNPGIAD